MANGISADADTSVGVTVNTDAVSVSVEPSTPDTHRACTLCVTARDTGYWGDSAITHCGRGYGGSEPCHRTWSRTSREAHCTICHQHFGGTKAFDEHLHGDKHGEPPEARYVLVDGRSGPTWIGKASPEWLSRIEALRAQRG